MNHKILTILSLLALTAFSNSPLVAQTVSVTEPPTSLEAGAKVKVTVEYTATFDGIVQIQLIDSSWKNIAEAWVEVKSGSGKHAFSINVPSDTVAGKNCRWQGLLYDSKWVKKAEVVAEGVSIANAVATEKSAMPDAKQLAVKPASTKYVAVPAGKEWLPELDSGQWKLDWADEFSGTGEPKKWYPLLGYNHVEFAKASEKGIRWSGPTEDTAWMYSTRSGNHWLNGDGQLVMRIVTDKTENNKLGPKVKAAYLLSGRPVGWDSTVPNGSRWDGKFVAATKESPLYICARVKTDEVVGHSTWFAFWLFTETRAYNNNPEDGTEMDIIEIAKGKKKYLDHSFNVANHWGKGKGTSESKQFNTRSDPVSTELVDVTDSDYHTYGIEWTTEKMTCFVDGKPYYTFTENIPTKPVDMMMLLTLEFKKNAWDPDQGDGRTEGPAVSEDEKIRVMSQVSVDYVRVYKKE